MFKTGTSAATAGGEYEGAKTYAEHKRCLRGLESPHTNFTVREEIVEGRHAQAGDRLHKLPQRARQGGQG